MELQCNNCGKIFRRIPSKVRKKSNFCSRKCFNLTRHQNYITPLSHGILEKLYSQKGLTQNEIAKLYGFAQSSIYNWMKLYNIPARKHKQIKTPLIEKTILENFYLKEKMNLTKLGLKFGVHATTIRKWLKKYDMPLRSPSEALKGRKSANKLPPFTSKSNLTHLYLEKKLSSYKIATLFNVSPNTILRLMKSYNIKARIPSELKHSLESRKKMSQTQKLLFKNGELIPWNKGKPYLKLREYYKDSVFKERRRKAISVPKSPQAGKNISMAQKRLWKNPEFAKKKMQSFQRRPTKPERKLIKIVNDNKLPLKYVGDGKIIIHSLCPDFIGTNNEKKIVELFGDYWHNPEKRNLKPYQTSWGRTAIFKRYGYDALIVWEHELNDSVKVTQKINAFIKGDVF